MLLGRAIHIENSDRSRLYYTFPSVYRINGIAFEFKSRSRLSAFHSIGSQTCAATTSPLLLFTPLLRNDVVRHLLGISYITPSNGLFESSGYEYYLRGYRNTQQRNQFHGSQAS